MKKIHAGLVVGMGLSVLAFSSSAKADAIGIGSGLALDQLPLAIQYEYDLSKNVALTAGLSTLVYATGGASYFWQDTKSGPYTSARAGVNLLISSFTLYAQQGYRFALGTNVALDVEAGLGFGSVTSTQFTGSSYQNVQNSAVLPSLGLRLSFKF